jgi:hypothetical protein
MPASNIPAPIRIKSQKVKISITAAVVLNIFVVPSWAHLIALNN